MLRRCGVAAFLVIAGWTASAQAQDELRDLVLKAQKAHGGKEALTKYQGVQVRYKGDVDVNGMQAKIDGEVSYNFPDRMKNVINVDVNGMKIEVQQGFDGKALWMSVLGKTQEIKDKDQIAEMKANMYAEVVASLMDIESKHYELTTLGGMKIKDKDAVGVRVSKKGERFVDLWFDKKTNLLVKSESRGKDPFGMGGEALQEKYYSGYMAVSGIQTPQQLEVHNDGKRIVTMELSDTRYHEKLDDTHFGRP